MKELFRAILTRWNNCSITGDLWNTSAPQNTSLPYTVFTLISDIPEQTFNSMMEHCRIQFLIFSDEVSIEQVMDIGEEIKACFENYKLTFTAEYSIACSFTRTLAYLIRTPEDTWEYLVEFKCSLNRLNGPFNK